MWQYQMWLVKNVHFQTPQYRGSFQCYQECFFLIISQECKPKTNNSWENIFLFQRLKISRNRKEIESSFMLLWKSCSLFGHAEVSNKHQVGQKPQQSKQEPHVRSEWVCSLNFQSQWISSKVRSYSMSTLARLLEFCCTSSLHRTQIQTLLLNFKHCL